MAPEYADPGGNSGAPGDEISGVKILAAAGKGVHPA